MSSHPLAKLMEGGKSQNTVETVYFITMKFMQLVREEEKSIILNFLRTVPLFSVLTLKSLRRMHERMKKIKVKWGEFVIKEGEYPDIIFIIRDGDFEVQKRLETER